VNSANSSSRGAGRPAIIPNLLPYWEKEWGRLWYGNLLIKEFHQRAPFQRLALDVFQESNWKSRIDDLLPWDENVDSQERLRNIAKGLNRDQIIQILNRTSPKPERYAAWLYTPVSTGNTFWTLTQAKTFSISSSMD